MAGVGGWRYLASDDLSDVTSRLILGWMEMKVIPVVSLFPRTWNKYPTQML